MNESQPGGDATQPADPPLFGSMGPDRYLRDRVEQYRGWYDRKAVRAKARYLWMRGLSVAVGAIAPVLVNVTSLFLFR